MLSRLEIVRNQIVDGLLSIQTTNKPGTSEEFYRTDVKRVEKSVTVEGTLPFLCVDYHEIEWDFKAPFGTDNWQVFDLLAKFEIWGFYGAAMQTAPGENKRPLETVGHPMMHDVLRWLAWNAVTYRQTADKWMVDGATVRIKAKAYDWDANRGDFLIAFQVRAKNVTRDL